MERRDRRDSRRPPRERVASEILRKQKEDEIKLTGQNACLSLFQNRPQDIVKVYLNRKAAHDNPELLRWCAANRRAYKLTENSELHRLTDSLHHEGICILAKKQKSAEISEVLAGIQDPSAVIVVLENVSNPHNVGAIARVAAHFGALALVNCGKDAPEVSPAMARVAEGGLEKIQYALAHDMAALLQQLKGLGFRILGTAPGARKNIYSFPFKGRVALVFGSENSGMTKPAKALCDDLLLIPGTGAVESLNVACAATALLGEIFRQRNVTAFD